MAKGNRIRTIENEILRPFSFHLNPTLIVSVNKNYMYEILNDFMDNIEKSFKGNKMITFQKGKGIEMNSPKTIIETENMDTYKMSCCDREIKAISIDNELYCPFCGGEIHGDNN